MEKGNKTFANIATAVVILAIGWWIFSPGSSEPEETKEPLTRAELKLQSMDRNWPDDLRLDRAGVADVTEYMGESPDGVDVNRSNGERKLYYEFSDESLLVFVMQPAATEDGLVLEYVTTE